MSDVLFPALEAIATAVIAGFTITQWRSDTLTRQARVREVDSRISTIGFQLRRQIRSWLGMDGEGGANKSPISRLARWVERHRLDYSDHVSRAEQRLEEMASLADEAGPEVSTGVKAAFVLFLGGTRRLNQWASTDRPRDETEFDYDRLPMDAEKDLTSCITALERGVIDTNLLIADKKLDELREAQDPFKQLADEIIRQRLHP
ncbi:MAG TPA: hypothetical protein VNJ06_13265 [Gemmatimonadales bacterium]|nr:hypothetical protein [Gemmatimonadales bacterium]